MRFGCPPVGFRRKRLLFLSFHSFLMEFLRIRKSGNLKGRQRNFLIFFLFFFFFSFSFLEKEEEKGTERWMERIGVWNHSGRLFSSKDRFFETPDPLFGWSSGSFTLNKLECSKQAKQHALNTLAWDNGTWRETCFVGFFFFYYFFIFFYFLLKGKMERDIGKKEREEKSFLFF